MNPTLRADAARNRERLLELAREDTARGDLSLQLNDLARRAGVGVGTVYRHFPTREALLETLVRERFYTLLEVARDALEEEDPWTGFERLIRRQLELELLDPGFAQVVAAVNDEQAETTELKKQLGRAGNQLLRRAQRAGVIRPDVKGDDIRRLTCGVNYAVSLGTGKDDRVATAHRYAAVLLEGLRRPARVVAGAPGGMPDV